MKDKGFIFDYSKCVGCHACIVGCFIENKTNPPMAWRQINSLNQKKIPLAGSLNLSIACNHCLEAPCLKACPAKAYYRDEHTGAVIHQSEKCIGCKYCTWACPFDAPKFNKSSGTIEKCHLCNHLIIDGFKPACAKQCPTGALTFDSIDKSNNILHFGLPNTAFQPRINTLNSDVLKNIPEMDLSITGYDPDNMLNEEPDNKIHALNEWPLVVFTFIFTFLSGWIFSFQPGSPLILKGIFILLGIIGIIISTLHLGKPFRAPRSIINLKTSWLSREILLSGLFISTSIVFLFLFHSFYILLIISLLSILLLSSIEMVYSLPQKKYTTPFHSANTLLTAILFGSLFTGQFKLLVIIIVVKALLYLIRKKNIGNITIWIISGAFIRTILGFCMPLSLIFFTNPLYTNLLFICLLVGELIDRFEFYNDLYLNSPSAELDLILKKELK